MHSGPNKWAFDQQYIDEQISKNETSFPTKAVIKFTIQKEAGPRFDDVSDLDADSCRRSSSETSPEVF